MKEFENRLAIVTGTTGIGRAIAKRLATGGAAVVACGIEPAANYQLQHEAEMNKLMQRVDLVDVTRPGQVQAMVAKTAMTIAAS